MDGYVARLYSSAMVGVTFLITFLPVWVDCAGDGNIGLLEDEVATALKSCINQDINNKRQRRSDDSYDGSARIDHVMKQINTYSHERRNFNDTRDGVLNGTDFDYEGYENSNTEEEFLTSPPPPAVTNETNDRAINVNRTKRNVPLIIKPDTEQCLSQCVFANLQVVDSRGIPREAELWNKVQASVTSQQSRSALRDQIRACFQELQSETEDDGCSYSNKLERCLMLRFMDRNPHTNENQEKDKNQSPNL